MIIRQELLDFDVLSTAFLKTKVGICFDAGVHNLHRFDLMRPLTTMPSRANVIWNIRYVGRASIKTLVYCMWMLIKIGQTDLLKEVRIILWKDDISNAHKMNSSLDRVWCGNTLLLYYFTVSCMRFSLSNSDFVD